ncbi:hypothetical protein TWF102_010771 [Orbilia oligospora]|uniref:Heat shock 70 kDa protein 12A n=1 Tax=Orbilia oligospora TaxID=2813651 RepID=A0A7C8JBK7_ORBOL|nr:hypothetical protein TWF102_010771 [Orbilia oligospora]KAF3111518.1 hypothetical protein TWF103_003468 [Orbilia oligospora]KAF3147912.1 hypothetical protein TWF594_001846 [Orbilia oligospora]
MKIPFFKKLKNVKATANLTANDIDSDSTSAGGYIPENIPIPSTISVGHKRRSSRRGPHRLVIGIDFGTTHSGVSYALIYHGKNPENVKVKQVNWHFMIGDATPNLGGKIPSIIGMEKTNDESDVYWGFQKIPSGCDIFQWMKILLEPFDTSGYQDSSHVQMTKNFLDKHGLTAVELVSKYLRLIWNAAKVEIDAYEHQIFERAEIEKTVVLSVPAGWSEKATQNTYAAAALAFRDQGIDYKKNLKLINEPAAAAIHVLTQEKKDRPDFVKEEDCVIVCDAGGGTVDVVTFQVTNMSPHLVLEEKVAPKGGLCGSIYLDKAFEPVLSSMIGQRKPRNGNPLVDDLENARDIVTKQFNREVKTQFGGEHSKSRVFTTSFYPAVKDPQNPETEISELRFTFETLRAIFEPICHKIWFLINSQIEKLEELNLLHKLKVVVLVGGFGNSQYLRQFLREQLARRGSSVQLKMLANGEGIASVAKGAVLAEAIGITRIFNVFVARHNIGVEACQIYDPKIHSRRHRFVHSITGEDSVYTVVWFVEMGSPIRNSITKEIAFIFWVTDSVLNSEATRIPITPRLLLSDEGRPRHPDSAVRRFVKVEFDVDKEHILHSPLREKLTKKNSTETYHRFDYFLVITWGIANLEFSCKIDGKVVVARPSTVSYYE